MPLFVGSAVAPCRLRSPYRLVRSAILLPLAVAEEAITQMQSEQANLRRQYEELCTTNSVAALDVSSMRRIEKLE